MSSSQEITSCEVCGSAALEPVLDLGLHPLCDDLVPIGDSRTCRQYPIEILFCRGCATAHQRFQPPKAELFPPNYHYRARFTADVLRGMASLVDSCGKRMPSLAGALVLDVGCNDASLLDLFRSKGARTVGLEPTDAYRDGVANGHDVFNDFVSVDVARRIRQKHGRPDVITFTNVFAHIEDLRGVLEALRELMSPSTMLVVENHHLGAVLDRCQFDTFYHEHPRTYSLSSFRHIAASLGVALSGVEFPARYGGNIRVFLNAPVGGTVTEQMQATLDEERLYPRKFARMRSDIERWKALMSDRIGELVRRHGRLPAKAFPGRAAILVRMLGIDERVVEAVYEKPGSLKIGNYVPGTRIPILSDVELFSRSPPPVMLNFAWHISAEIQGYLREHGIAVEIVDIMNPRDLSPGR